MSRGYYDDLPLIVEPKPDVDPISSDSRIGKEAVEDNMDEQLPLLPVDSMMEAYAIN